MTSVPEVTAILRHDKLFSKLTHYKKDGREYHRVIDAGALLRAWQALTPKERLFLSMHYGLDGEPPLSSREMSSRLNRPPAAGLRISDQIVARLREHMWPSPSSFFAGLSKATIKYIVSAGVGHPRELPQHINCVVKQEGFGKGRLSELEVWLATHSYPSLMPCLDGEAYRKLRLA